MEILTILTAHVPEERWEELTELFRNMSKPENLPGQMVSTSLGQSRQDPNEWKALSIWRSAAALTEYRASVEVPEGIAMFRAVGAQPALSLLELRVHSEH